MFFYLYVLGWSKAVKGYHEVGYKNSDKARIRAKGLMRVQVSCVLKEMTMVVTIKDVLN